MERRRDVVNAEVRQSAFETSPAAHAKLLAFKSRVMKQHTVYLFKTAEELARVVATDLAQYRK